MTKTGKIISLFYSTLNARTPTTELKLDDQGILKDKHYGKNVERSVLLTSLDSYKLVSSHGIDVDHGALGENLLIDYNPYRLSTGTRLKIGTVILEISIHCTLCKSLTKVDAKLPKLLKEDRGIFAKVVESGVIKENDNIYLLD
ncbi:MAG: MOSC domain-containing protein [Campylobacterota bacterium]